MKPKIVMAMMLLAFACGASAGPSIGNADVSDTAMDDDGAADGIAFSLGNGQDGPAGNPAVFDHVFTGKWNLLTKVDAAAQVDPRVAPIGDAKVETFFAIIRPPSVAIFSFTSTENVVVDLVLAINGGGATTSFLFKDVHLVAGEAHRGSFFIDWLDADGRVPAYSNLTVFYRNAISPVAEPAPYGMMVGGLGLVALAARRKKGRMAAAAHG